MPVQRRPLLATHAAAAATVCLALLLLPTRANAQAQGVYRELFTGFDRANNSLAQLTNDARFLNNTPTSTSIMPSFRMEQSLGDDYGQRVRGFIVAPSTGNYTFWIASDEVSQLFLSTDEDPAHKRLIAYVDPRVQPDNYTTFSSQQSSNIVLQSGQRYYVEALHKEANLIDHLSVQWRLPSAAMETPIPGTRLVYEIAPLLTTIPADQTVEEGRPAVWSVETANFLRQSYRWQRNGFDLPGATNKAYRLPAVTLADAEAAFRVFVTNQFGTTNTAEVTLHVLRDTNAPTVRLVYNGNRTTVVVEFSEPVESASALQLSNYQINGIAVQAAGFGNDAGTVLLTTAPLSSEASYTISIIGVRDLASQANTLVATQRVFVAHDFTSGTLGSPALAGSVVPVSGGSDVTGGGQGLGGSADEAQFAYQLAGGDFDVRVRVQGFAASQIWAEAGIIARESLDADSRFAGTFTTPGLAGSFFQARTNTHGLATAAGSYPASFPNTWLRLQRTGDRLSGYTGRDGISWAQLGAVTCNLSNRLYLGLAVTSQASNQTATAEFREFSPTGPALPETAPPPTEVLGASSRRTGLVISEIMYHPQDTYLGANKAELEFVEIFNSNPFEEDISGHRLSGDIDYRFPPGTILAGGAFAVVARVPADVEAVYQISGVYGPFTNNLPNDSGRVRLRNELDAVLLEVNYSSHYPWPVAADGAGHSLVLAHPSYGEGQHAAWAASDAIGGSPGRMEPFGSEPLRPVVINEFLAHTDFAAEDFIELYNRSGSPIDLGGAFLTDSASTNKFRLRSPTMIPAHGFASFDQAALGFALDAGGERLYLVNSNQTRVIDALGFEGQANGVSSGRSPDGGPTFQELATPTPHAPNSPALTRDVVINEIMYHPISGDGDDEYVELYNKGIADVDLTGWRFVHGIDFKFGSNVVLAAGGYLVVARNQTNLIAHYPQLNDGNTVGNFDGSLRNSGERLSLAMPQLAINTDHPPAITTNLIYVIVDEVEYGAGGSWGRWSDGGGSSLELIDPRSDNRLAANWADSDETGKAPWSNIETTGVLDNGGDTPSALHVMLLEEGECLLDNVEVFPGASANLIPNPGFESGTNGWVMRGNHQRSSLETNGAYAGARSLHVRASSRGDIGANKIFVNFSGLTAGQTATIRAKARWLRGWPELLLRLRGSYLEATDRMIVPANLGTPGARNSRALANAGPALTGVTHAPAVPAADQPILVTARAADPDGVASLTLRYRIDPSPALASVAMTDDGSGGDAVAGDGIYSAIVPGQPKDTVLAFIIEATDGAVPAAVTRFPALRDDNGPVRECLVHFGSPIPASSFGTYRFWITQDSINNWAAREVLSNERIPGTFVYGNQRIIYDAGARYSGSPAHQDQAAPDYSPVGTPNHYTFDVPSDDLILGTDNLNKVHGSGNNHHDDNTLVREVTAYWMARRLGLPQNYKRYVQMFINGARRGSLMEDTQVPNSEVVNEVFADDPDGDLFKLAIWYEFGAPAQVLSANGLGECYLNNYVTTGGVKKRARYRWNWQGRALHGTANNYTNVYGLIDAANTPATGPFAQNLNGIADIDQWMRTFALEHAVGNWDSFGYRNEQNMFAYKPEHGRWQLLIWDINIIFGGGTRGAPIAVDGDLLEIDTANVGMTAIYNHPQFRRAYWRTLRELAEGAFVNANVDPFMDARFRAFAASGVSVGSPDFIKLWISQRRAYILSQLATVDTASFSVTTPPGFSTDTNLVAITGTAPLGMTALTINGIARLLTWTSLSNWTVRVPLDQANNPLTINALDRDGHLLSAPVTLNVQYTGPLVRPEDAIVINEIQYHPLVPETGFVEILNISSNVTFDLSGWRLRGVDFTFPEGSFITNRQALLLVENRAAFSQTYGISNFVTGEFAGQLDHGGETLTLERPTNLGVPATNLIYAIVDRVRYDDRLPWPPRADGTGPSLQLMDATRDNSRVGNWTAGNAWLNITRTGNISVGVNLLVSLTGAGNCFIDDITLIGPGGTNIVRNGDFESDLSGPWQLSANLAGSYITNGVSHSGGRSLFVSSTAPGGALTTSIVQSFADLVTSNVSYTLSYWIQANTNPVSATVRTFPGSALNLAATAQLIVASPGAPNPSATSLPAFDPIWLNELQAVNVDGPLDNAGEHEPWIELFNAGPDPVGLDGYYLTDSYTSNLTQWAFPAGATLSPGEFKIVWADGEPAEGTAQHWHTNFRLPAGTGTVALVRIVNARPQITDYLTYADLGPNLGYGSVPDGQPFDRQTLYVPTPGAANYASAIPVFINEWMAGNTNALADPADGDFEDWFELFNAGTNTVDLSGYFLSDSGDPFKFEIPPGYVIQPHGFLLVWADEESGQNQSDRPDLHVNFRLGLSGETITLTSPTGDLVDRIAFGQQTNDVSQGRYADGAGSLYFMTVPTPRGPNVIGGAGINTPPQLQPLFDRTVTLGQTLSFQAVATDSDIPAQTLRFALINFPSGASIDAVTGRVTWTPTSLQTPSTNSFTVRVTDDGVPPLSSSHSFAVRVAGPPRIGGITPPVAGALTLTVPVIPGKTYRVEYKDNLNAATWSPLGGDRHPATETLVVQDNLAGGPQRFYRVVILD
jgi:hypothetical protein